MRHAAIVLACALAAPAFAQSPSPYSITQTFTLGGDGFWDYVVPDPPNHRLYVARQTRVMVVDERTGKLVGEVQGVNGAHGTAIVEDTGHGFATASGDKAVVMFDLGTLKELAKIPAADDADAIIYDPASKRVLSFNGDANNATVIEPREGSIEYSIDRFGGDYRNFEAPMEPTGAACKAACDADNRCRAWTYVRPGYIAVAPRCYLKSKLTRPRHKPCCISGVVR